MRDGLESLVFVLLVTAMMAFLSEAPAQQVRSDGPDPILGICPPQGPGGELLVSGTKGNGSSEFKEEFAYDWIEEAA